MSATKADIVLFRNERRQFSVQCADELGSPIDITSTTLSSSAKVSAGDVVVVASAAFTKDIPTEGVFSFVWNGADFDNYGSHFSEVRFPYDFKVDDDVVLYGQIILNPGVTS